MRLIDADLLDEEIANFFVCITGTPKQHTVVNECKSSFRKMIEEQPTVEPIHGKWENMDRYDEWECSECGHQECGYDEYPTDGKNGLNFCPNCGADMRKKEKECKTATNADRIRNMTDEELAEFVSSGEWACICPMCEFYGTEDCAYDEKSRTEDKKNCAKGIMKWLKSPVEV